MIGEQEPAFSFRRSFRERHGFVARPSNGLRRTVSKRSLFSNRIDSFARIFRSRGFSTRERKEKKGKN